MKDTGKWTPRQKRQYIEGALGDIDKLTTEQTDIIQKLTDKKRWYVSRDKTIAQLIEVTESIRKINETIQSRMEGSNWSKYN